MLNTMRFAFVIFIISLFGLNAARAQEKGSISGRVLDENRGLLQGARVDLQPTGRAAVTDAQGQFTISDLPPGKYTLTVSYVGFTPFSEAVDVVGGATSNHAVTLKVESVNQQVLVSGERERGEVEALNREENADNIVQVLPAEVITSLPNTNIADALGRLPSVSLERDEGEGKYVQIRGTEPRLSNVTVDGVHLPSPESVRNVKLDAIPAALVDSVEIHKTLSPSQEGDAIGGSINLVTKRAGEQPFLSIEGRGGYTPIGFGGLLDQFGATFGRRFGREKRLGFLIGGSYDYNQRGTNDIEPVPGTTSVANNGDFADGVPVFFGTDIREYKFYRHRYGFAGSADYKIGQNSVAYLRGLFSHFIDNGDNWNITQNFGSFATPTTNNGDGSMNYTHVVRRPHQRIFNLIAGANHSLGKTLITYEAAFGQARSTRGFFSAFFSGPQNVQFVLDASHPFTPKFNQVNTISGPGGNDILDPANYNLGGPAFNFFRDLSFGTDNHIFERDLTGSISVARQYTVGSRFGVFEVGAKVRDAHKSSLFFERAFNPASRGQRLIPLDTVVGLPVHGGFYFGAYKLLPFSNFDKILSFYNANQGLFSEQTDFEHQFLDTNDFTTKERVVAGYVQNTITVGHFKVLGGLRIEGTQASFIGTIVQFNNGVFVPPDLLALGEQTYVNFLPSVQVQYNINGTTNLRAAYGRGIARPNFSDLPPFKQFDPSSNPPHESDGNPNLKPTHANDYDLLFEHYLKTVGVIQVGWFYKALSDPILATQLSPTTGQANNLVIRKPVNGPSAHIQGVEFAWEQHLTFLPGLLNGMGVAANYSHTTSQASFPLDPNNNNQPTRADHPALLRQAPNNWNFDVTYDKGPISARMGLTHNDANIAFYNFTDGAPGGIKGPNGDDYFYPHTQVDAQVSYLLPHVRGVHMTVSFLNLTNEVFGFYQGSEQFPIQREYYSRTISAGFRWTSSPDVK